MNESEQVDRSPAGVRHSRWGLYLPVVLLALLVAGWSVFWFSARARALDTVELWLAREAAEGRRWSCPQRAVGGFPFRFELRCENATFTGETDIGPATGELKRFLAVSQVYRPQHVILEVEGPLVARSTTTGASLTLDWRSFDASVVISGDLPERVAVSVTEPTLTVSAPDSPEGSFKAEAMELHARQTPERAGAYDLALDLRKASVPELDALLATSDAADMTLRATVSDAEVLARGATPARLEAWRERNGAVELTRLALVKGPQSLEASGRLGIDALHRPEGTIEASVAGLEGLLARFGLGGNGLGGLIAGGLSVLGGGRPDAPEAPGAGAPGMTRLPPIRFTEGRILLGPFQIGTLSPLR